VLHLGRLDGADFLEQPKIIPAATTIQDFLDILSCAQHSSRENDIVLAFEETGLVIFGPPTIGEGDVVFQFPGSEILGVINPDQSRYLKSIARAVNAERGVETAQKWSLRIAVIILNRALLIICLCVWEQRSYQHPLSLK
jgi:hypothetical protein